MAQITVCDRCKKELVARQTLINIKPYKYILGIEVYTTSAYRGDFIRTSNHTFELCDDCANKLGEFLHYTGSEEIKEET